MFILFYFISFFCPSLTLLHPTYPTSHIQLEYIFKEELSKCFRQLIFFKVQFLIIHSEFKNLAMTESRKVY